MKTNKSRNDLNNIITLLFMFGFLGLISPINLHIYYYIFGTPELETLSIMQAQLKSTFDNTFNVTIPILGVIFILIAAYLTRKKRKISKLNDYN